MNTVLLAVPLRKKDARFRFYSDLGSFSTFSRLTGLLVVWLTEKPNLDVSLGCASAKCF